MGNTGRNSGYKKRPALTGEKDMRNISVFIIPIIVLSFILRVFNLDRVPPGFWFDEASFSYSAYSVLETGRDEFGQFLPLAFKSFGQYNAPLIFYWLVPFIKLFGLSVFTVRFSMAVLGVLTTLGVFLLGKELSKKTEIGLAAAFFFAVSPFSLQFNRMVHENNLLVCLLVFGSFFFLKGLEKGRDFLLSALLLVMTFYTYLAARVFTPLFLILLVFVFKKEILSKKKEFFMAGAGFFILLIPFLWFLTTPAAWPRTEQTSLFSDPGIILRINEARGKYGNPIFGRIIHNKITGFSQALLGNYLSHFNPRYLFLEGDPVKIYKTPGVGVMHFWEFILFLLGVYFLLKREYRRIGVFLLGWFLLAFLPASLTRFVPSSSRSFQASPAISLISGFGLWFVWQKVSHLKYKGIIFVLGGIFFVLNMAYYFNQYYLQLPKAYAYEWRDGAAKAIQTVKTKENKYQRIVIDQEGISYVNVLFFLKYPPELFQKEAFLTAPDKFGFSYVPKFGKYYFIKDLPPEPEPDTLYLLRSDNLFEKSKLLTTIKDNTGKDAFYFVEK